MERGKIQHEEAPRCSPLRPLSGQPRHGHLERRELELPGRVPRIAVLRVLVVRGAYKNNANSWQTFCAGGIDFIIVHLECNAPDDVLEWAGNILDNHPGLRAIVTTHMYLGPLEKPQKPEDYYDAPKGRMRWKKCHGSAGNTPQQMWDKCFRKHKNLSMILCGDQSRTQAFYQCSTGDAGNAVHEVLSD